MFKIVQAPVGGDWGFKVDPNAEFEPGTIKQLSVVGVVVVEKPEKPEEKKPEESDV